MRAITIDLAEVLTLVVCARDYGWDRSGLLFDFWKLIGRELSDEDIEAFISERISDEHGYTETDQWQAANTLRKWRDSFRSDSAS